MKLRLLLYLLSLFSSQFHLRTFATYKPFASHLPYHQLIITLVL